VRGNALLYQKEFGGNCPFPVCYRFATLVRIDNRRNILLSMLIRESGAPFKIYLRYIVISTNYLRIKLSSMSFFHAKSNHEKYTLIMMHKPFTYYLLVKVNDNI